MDKTYFVICKETKTMMTLLGILVVVAALFVIFGWGQSPNTVGRQSPQFPISTSVGAQVTNIDRWNQDALGLKNRTGVIIYSVTTGSVADQAGLQHNDVVYNMANSEIENTGDFREMTNSLVSGKKYEIRIYRAGRKQRLNFVYTPAPTAQGVAAVTKETVTWMGADVQNIDPLLQKHFGFTSSDGAIVSFVEPKTPADAAGMQQGDVILEFDGRRVKHISDLQRFIQSRQPGEKVQISLLRGGGAGRIITPFVILTSKPLKVEQKPAYLPPPSVEVEATWIGLTLEPITRVEAKDLGLSPGQSGMVIEAITKDSPGAKAGMRIEDVILSVNGKQIKGLQTFEASAGNAEGAVLDVLRGGRRLYVTIPPPKPFIQKNAGNLRQVAMQDPSQRLVAVGSYGTDLFAQVYPTFEKAPYILIYNPSNASLEAIKNPDLSNPDVVCRLVIQRGAGVVLTGNIDTNCQLLFASENITVYPGVFGYLYNAIKMYKSGQLVASNVDVSQGP